MIPYLLVTDDTYYSAFRIRKKALYCLSDTRIRKPRVSNYCGSWTKQSESFDAWC
ncbi:MAG: hypothetical protein IJ079_06715 [Lachnospiraceae bacterium]|nr:hypothetical protein [Lachnospiraceae bacterium]